MIIIIGENGIISRRGKRYLAATKGAQRKQAAQVVYGHKKSKSSAAAM